MIIQNDIKSRTDWKKFLLNLDALEKIVQFIIKSNNISTNKIKQINLGTNVIFDLGKYILKIYAVDEETNSFMDWSREIILSNLLKSSSPYVTPRIIKSGYFKDYYRIYYNIMEKINNLSSFSDIINDTTSLQYKYCIQELHNIISFFHSLKININVAKQYSRPLRNYIAIKNEYDKYLKKYFSLNTTLNFGIVHGDLSESNIYFNEKGEIVILDFEDWMYAPDIVEYPIVCFELLKSSQVRIEFLNDTSFEMIEKLIVATLLHHESEKFLKLISLQMGKDKLPSISELRLFYSNQLLSKS